MDAHDVDPLEPMETMDLRRAPFRPGFHWQWLGRIALSMAVLSAGGLCLVLWLIAPGSHDPDYFSLMRSRAITHQSLGPALLVGGLALAAAVGVMTWMLALYASHRIAGPLFRFDRNLQAAIESGQLQPVPIRQGDHLQAEARMLKAVMEQHQQHLNQLRDELALALRHDHSDARAQKDIASRLRAILNRARY